jgi:hypothetical protein
MPGLRSFHVCRDRALAYRQRTKCLLPQLLVHIGQECLHSHLLDDITDRVPVHPSSAGAGVARNPVPRHEQRRRIAHQVVQITKAAARIGRRPAVQLGLCAWT